MKLVTWHLWRLAESTDLELCFAEALRRHMIDEDNEAFIRRCLALGEQLDAGQEPAEPVTMDMVHELHACAIRLNTADSA